MKLAARLLGHRQFLSRDQIGEFIRTSKNFDSHAEDPERSKALLIFETSTQHTWLVASHERLYCILDDVRKPAPNINWSIRRNELLEKGRVIIPITTHPKTEKTGFVDIGPNHQNWIFSHALFQAAPIEHAVENLILSTMKS